MLVFWKMIYWKIITKLKWVYLILFQVDELQQLWDDLKELSTARQEALAGAKQVCLIYWFKWLFRDINFQRTMFSSILMDIENVLIILNMYVLFHFINNCL